MNKTELINAVAAKAEISKKDAEKALAAVLGSIEDALKAGDKVQLIGFGTFETRERAAKEGRNPRTGETMTVPATKVPAFKAGAALKAAVVSVEKNGFPVPHPNTTTLPFARCLVALLRIYGSAI